MSVSERAEIRVQRGQGASSASGSNEIRASLPYLILQMKDLREPMHILMDCCPSFLTVPVFKSRMRPEDRRESKMLLQHEAFSSTGTRQRIGD